MSANFKISLNLLRKMVIRYNSLAYLELVYLVVCFFNIFCCNLYYFLLLGFGQG